MRTNNEAVGFLDRLGWCVRRVPTETSLEVFVPPGVFSSGSWAITRILAGMFTSGRTPIDDCARRKRAGRNAVLAFISIVPAFLTELFNLLILALLLIAGMREISLDPLKHPFTYPPTDAFDDSEPSRWYYREVREGSLRDDGTTNFRTEYVPKPWTSFILKPPTLFGLGALYGLVWLVAHFQTLQWILLGVVGVVLLILLGVGIFTATQKLRAGRLAPKPGVLQAELAAILAGATVEPRASVWLRVETLKAKVCRPIAR